jgi:hypothetical protein
VTAWDTRRGQAAWQLDIEAAGRCLDFPVRDLVTDLALAVRRG